MLDRLLYIFYGPFARPRHYKTEWVDDLPATPRMDTIYVVGGRKYPFRVVMPCPHPRCNHLVYLDIARGSRPHWRLREHDDGSLSLMPSVYLTKMPCRSHYWVRMGRVAWTGRPWTCRLCWRRQTRYRSRRWTRSTD